MRCESCRDALSARLDGEEPGRSVDDLEAHLGRCAECRRFSLEITDLHRVVRVRSADAVPDLTGSILAAHPVVVPTDRQPVGSAHPGSGTLGWLRYGLVVIGLTMLAIGLPSLVLHDSGIAIHLTRELSAWDVAFGVGLLFAAWQPTRARGLLPMAAVLVGAQLLGSIIDVTSGRSPLINEAHHGLELVGVLLLWLLCRHVGHATPTRATSSDHGWRTA